MRDDDAVEIYRRYRPSTFGEVLGQDAAVRTLQKSLENKALPHALLLTGGSGCGKTTIARILKVELDCGDSDFYEINAADDRGVDMVRQIRSVMGLAPMRGGCRIWLIDEVHRATSDAQSALLKMLEDTPKHVYFFLCTTDPQKLLKTIHTRCTEVKLVPLTDAVMRELITAICQQEKVDLSDGVVNQIVDMAEGSARKALVLLHQVLQQDDEKEQLASLLKADSKRQTIDLCRLMMEPRPSWPDIAKIVKALEDEPETTRRIILGYFNSVLLGGGRGAGRAFAVIQAFRDHLYDSGKAGLTASLYEVFVSAKP